MTTRPRPRAAQITVRLPADVAQYVKDRAHEQGVDTSSVVVAALRAAMWRHEGERERATLSRVRGDPYPELPAASADEVAVVWRDLDG